MTTSVEKGDSITSEIDKELSLYYEINNHKNYEHTSRRVCKQGSESTGHDDFPPSKMETGSPDVWVNSVPISRRTDVWEPHANEFSSHQMMNWEGSETVFVNGMAVARVGDRVFYPGSYSEGGSEDVPTPTAKKPDPDSDDVIYLIASGVNFKTPYYVDGYNKPPVCGLGHGLANCNMIIKTGSEDVYCGSKIYEEVPGFGLEDDPTSVGWGCRYPRER